MKWLYTLSITYIALICLQPVLSFNVNLVVGPNQTISSAQVSGSDVHQTTSSEATAFNLTSQNIMNFLTAYMSGGTPNDYALGDPTDNGNNYAIYGFTPVTTTLTAVSAEILSYTTNPVILATKSYENTSPDVATFTGSVSQNVQNTVENDWSTTNTITTTQTINYGVSFLGTGGSGSTSLSYSAAFQQGGSTSQTISVGTDSGFTVPVPPGEEIDASLSSTQGTMTVRVYFEATVSGQIYYHYDDRYEGHYYWWIDVSDMSDLIPSVTMTDDISVSFFSQSQIVLTNPSNITAPAVVSDAVVSDALVSDTPNAEEAFLI